MTRLLAAAAALSLLMGCEPDYGETMDHAGREAVTPAAGRGAEHRLEVSGAADPQAISGNRPDSTATIHHPAADGNSGRPGDDSATAAASDHTEAH